MLIEFSSLPKWGNVGVIDEGKKLSMLSQFKWKEKDELTLEGFIWREKMEQ